LISFYLELSFKGNIIMIIVINYGLFFIYKKGMNYMQYYLKEKLIYFHKCELYKIKFELYKTYEQNLKNI